MNRFTRRAVILVVLVCGLSPTLAKNEPVKITYAEDLGREAALEIKKNSDINCFFWKNDERKCSGLITIIDIRDSEALEKALQKVLGHLGFGKAATTILFERSSYIDESKNKSKSFFPPVICISIGRQLYICTDEKSGTGRMHLRLENNGSKSMTIFCRSLANVLRKKSIKGPESKGS